MELTKIVGHKHIRTSEKEVCDTEEMMEVDRTYDDMFRSLGVCVSIAVIVVSIGKVLTPNYFYFLIAIFILILIIVSVIHHVIKILYSKRKTTPVNEIVRKENSNKRKKGNTSIKAKRALTTIVRSRTEQATHQLRSSLRHLQPTVDHSVKKRRRSTGHLKRSPNLERRGEPEIENVLG